MTRTWTVRDYAEVLDRATFDAAVRARATSVAKTGRAVVAREAGVSRTMIARLASGERTSCTWDLAERLERVVRVERGSLFRYVTGSRSESREDSAA